MLWGVVPAVGEGVLCGEFGEDFCFGGGVLVEACGDDMML